MYYLGIKNAYLPFVSKYVDKGRQALREQVALSGGMSFSYSSVNEFLNNFSRDYNYPACTRRWLIISGHREDDSAVVSGTDYELTDASLRAVLEGKHFFFIGFDVCSFGTVENLRSYRRYADIVAGSPIEEAEFGWYGIYRNFGSLLSLWTERDITAQLIKLFSAYYSQVYRKIGKLMENSGFPCQELNVVSSNVNQNTKVCVEDVK